MISVSTFFHLNVNFSQVFGTQNGVRVGNEDCCHIIFKLYDKWSHQSLFSSQLNGIFSILQLMLKGIITDFKDHCDAVFFPVNC